MAIDIALNILTPLQAVCLLVFAFVLGVCAGSSTHRLACRMVHSGNIFKRHDMCPTCKHSPRLVDFVPVFSWLFLRGTCKYCKTKILIHSVVEACTAFLFTLFVWRYGISIQAISYMILCCLLIGLALVDLETFTIPNSCIYAGILLWLASTWFIHPPTLNSDLGNLFINVSCYEFLSVLIYGLLGAVVIGGGMLCLSLLFEKVHRRPSLGGGDIKLLFMVGLYLGLPASVFNLFLACVIGLIFSLAWMVRKSSQIKGSKTTQPFPFGPSIATATIITLLLGSEHLTWYATFFT